MKSPTISIIGLIVLAGLASGCQDVAQMVLGTDGEYLLQAYDAVTVPGNPAIVQARLEEGTFLDDVQNEHLIFRGPGDFYAYVPTNDEGFATLELTARKTGDFAFRVTVPADFSAYHDRKAPAPASILLASRPPEQPVVVIDMDKTLVASGFWEVLTGDPKPMHDALGVVNRLSKAHTLVYLTHRPALLGPKSRAWLEQHGFPRAPLLLARKEDLLRGNLDYKKRRLEKLGQLFDDLEVGLGDKVSDMRAYLDAGMKAVLLVYLDNPGEETYEEALEMLSKVPPAVHVVRDWQQAEAVLFEGRSYPPAQAIEDIRKELRRLREGSAWRSQASP